MWDCILVQSSRNRITLNRITHMQTSTHPGSSLLLPDQFHHLGEPEPYLFNLSISEFQGWKKPFPLSDQLHFLSPEWEIFSSEAIYTWSCTLIKLHQSFTICIYCTQVIIVWECEHSYGIAALSLSLYSISFPWATGRILIAFVPEIIWQ